MNARTIERAIENYLNDGISQIAVITGTSAADRTAPSIRIICQSCALPDAFPPDAKERSASVLIAVVWSADKVAETDPDPAWLAQAECDRIMLAMESCAEVVVNSDANPEAGPGYDLDVLFHAAFLQDQSTDNDESLLVYAASYEIQFAYNQHANTGE
jgi:hypothetical protein